MVVYNAGDKKLAHIPTLPTAPKREIFRKIEHITHFDDVGDSSGKPVSFVQQNIEMKGFSHV